MSASACSEVASAALISRADLYVGSDTGITWLATLATSVPVVAITTVRVLPIVAREGRRRVPGRCTADMTLAAGLSVLATVRDIPRDRCLGAGRMNDIMKDLVARSSGAAVTMDLQ